MSTEAPEFSLPNVGPGQDPFSLAALADDVDFAVLFFQRDHYCTNCRSQVQSVADRFGEFRDRDAAVASIVPEPRERVAEWQSAYDLPYPLLADPDASVGEEYGQQVRFGILGNLSDFLGRMPAVVIVDRRADPPTIRTRYRGRSTFDRPAIDEILADLDEFRAE